MISLLIVDDESAIRDAIKMRINDDDDISVIGEACNGKDAISLCMKKKPDVVLMDIRMPEMDGLEATRIIKENNDSIKILVLTSHAEQENVHRAMMYRCNGFINKGAGQEELILIIKNVYKGFDVWSSDVAYRSGIFSVKENFSTKDELGRLTEKEISILKCLVRGLKNSDIAKELNYCEGYIRQLTVQMKEKLGVESTKALVVLGARYGL